MHIQATSTLLAADRSSLIQAKDAAEASRRARELRGLSVQLLAENSAGDPTDHQDSESTGLAASWSQNNQTVHPSGYSAAPSALGSQRLTETPPGDPGHRPVSFWA